MLYIIKGTSDKIYKLFGLSVLLGSGTKSADIAKDVFRTLYFGDKENCQYHIKTWLDGTKSNHSCYSQGNMSAGNLFFIFGSEPFIKENDELENYYLNKVNLAFAFVDQNKELNGLSLYYRRDDPTKWMIGLIKNTNLIPSKRQVYILTSVNPKSFVKDEKLGTQHFISATEKNNFVETLNDPFLAKFINFIIKSDGQIETNAEVIGQFLNYVSLNNEFKENKESFLLKESLPVLLSNQALQVAQQLDLQLSLSQIKQCLDEKSLLPRYLCQLRQLNVTEARNLASLLLSFEEAKLIEKWDIILSNEQLAKYLLEAANSLTDSLLKDAFSDEFIDSLLFIINQDVFNFFYEKINKAGGKAKDIWSNLAYLSQLKWELPKEVFKKEVLCQLICSINDISSLKTLLIAANEIDLNLENIFNPSTFAQFLIDGFYISHVPWQKLIELARMCQTKEQSEVCHNLIKLGLSLETIEFWLAAPGMHSIFANLFKYEADKQVILTTLELLKSKPFNGISKIQRNLELLNLAELSIAPILKDDTKGKQLLQIMHLIAGQDKALQLKLVKIAYGVITTDHVEDLKFDFNNILKNEKNTLFIYQFLATLRIINSLKTLFPASKDMLNLLTQSSEERLLFLKGLTTLENECHKIKKRFKQDLSNNLEVIEQADRNYRQKMYLIIFNQISNPAPKNKLLTEIKSAERDFLKIVDVDQRPWLRYMLAAIANSVALLLTAGIANIYHYRQSGDIFFFQRTAAGEAIKKLDIKIMEQLKPTTITT
ncbi:hypothetical protein ACNVED_00045 [Legionella sp. D16C41]|uniref:hypothetical protein n=1 Tax=Legionella sp. D16C41 TaxID=3402688 RepID=UPI003AF53B71